ncbi:MAG: pyruvate dehydrogenase [Planctomycetota bacterium]|nr:MAG: pyruvate dehydrogenase [Planctomycetota bacterium]
MSLVEFELPDLGEGVESGTIVKLLVREGDVIAPGQTVAEVEIDKATIELPCPHGGRIARLDVAEGQEVRVGTPLFAVETDAAPAEAPAPSASSPGEAASAAAASAAATSAPATSAPAGAVATAPTAPPSQAAGSGRAAAGERRVYPAGPAVRRLARLLGVDLGRVRGSGQRGRITAEDVHAYVQGLAGGNGRPAAAPPLPDFSAWGEVEALPLSTVRRRTAEHMARCWSLIPHVTQHDAADVTDLEAGRQAFKEANPQGPKVTMTAVLAKACAVALKAFPDLNSSLDLARGQQIFKHYVHIGIAVDTDYGLLVPVLRDVDRKPILQIAAELGDLAARARDKKLLPEEMRGGTFTITNLGGIGGRSFTPIVNWPEVAILGVSRSRHEVQLTPAGPRQRLMMPLSLSYDHRLIDGAQAARFVRYLAWLLSSPANLLFSG